MWGIPLASVASVLAVTYTGGRDADVAGAGPGDTPPVQRPGSVPKPPVLPPAPTEDAEDADAPGDGDADASAQPEDLAPADDETPPQPEVPALPPTAQDQPAPETPPATPRASAPMEPAHDDEPAPGTEAAPARSQRLLRPTDRRRFFSMSVGGSTGTSYYSLYFGGMDFQWQMAIGSHSKRFPNFGGAFVVQQRKGFINELTFAGRLQWDSPISDAFAIYSSVNFDLGVNVPIGYGGYFGLVTPPSALIGVGWAVKAILAERLLLGLRPISPNLIVPSFYSPIFVSVRWDVVASLGVVW